MDFRMEARLPGKCRSCMHCNMDRSHSHRVPYILKRKRHLLCRERHTAPAPWDPRFPLGPDPDSLRLACRHRPSVLAGTWVLRRRGHPRREIHAEATDIWVPKTCLPPETLVSSSDLGTWARQHHPSAHSCLRQLSSEGDRGHRLLILVARRAL